MEKKMPPLLPHHVHVYFNHAAHSELKKAEDLKVKIAQNFPDLQHGKLYADPVGPHMEGQFVVYAPDNRLNMVKEFLKAHNNGLSILIHPNTGNDIVDHSDAKTEWINKKPDLLNINYFKKHNP
jgi:DOPA 4,5-dioxygenase